MELSRVGLVTKSPQLLLLLCRDGVSLAQAVQGGAGSVEASSDAKRLAVERGRGSRCFLSEAHDRLEEVVVEPHLLIELVDGLGLFGSVKASRAQIGPDQGGVLLLHKAVVILVEGSAAGEGDVFDCLFPEADQVSVEEFAAVIGMDFQHGEGETS